ncbi:MAG: high-potential iron-sulfur protein [Candidatus Contendobacter sp.]
MTDHAPDNNRRRFIKLTAVGLVAAPFANALLSGTVRAADPISETDPQATALGYKADATKAEKRTDATALCSNCNFYSGKAGEASGPCVLFQGKLVAANGWCTAWAKKLA